MLYVVATSIGNSKDISLRAIDILKDADIVIGEERKEVSKLLKFLDIKAKPIELLNEHSDLGDIQNLLELCRAKKVALVSDAGTPGFCDPGSQLVALCRAFDIPTTAVPGASSLMNILSLSGHRIDKFIFEGFLPAEREERAGVLKNLRKEKKAIILMDTPYRLSRLLDELFRMMPDRKAVIGLDLTTDQEVVLEASISELHKKFSGRKAEFILILLPVK